MAFRTLEGVLHPDGKVTLSHEEIPDHPVRVMVTILEASDEASLSELGDYQRSLADYEDRLARVEVRWQLPTAGDDHQEMIMANLADLAQGFELRDASGRTFVFHPDPVVRELRVECQRLREQLAKVQAERDEYRQALDAIVEGAPVITRAELEDLEKNGIPGEQVLEEVERPLRERDNA